MRVVKARPEDYESVQAIIDECYPDCAADFKSEVWDYGCAVWLLENEGQILSMCSITESEVSITVFALSWVATPVKFQKLGYATHLLESLFNDIWSTLDLNGEYEYVILQLVCESGLARFYTFLGFRTVHISPDGYRMMLQEFIR